MAIITPDDLGGWMGKTVDPDRATNSIRVAEGWLLSVTRMDPWPTSIDAPEDLWAWAMELSALCYVNNPKATIRAQVENTVLFQWEPDAMARREAILDAARSRYNTTALPRGSFPQAQCWPDPADSGSSGEAGYQWPI